MSNKSAPSSAQQEKARKDFFDKLDKSSQPALVNGIKDLEKATTQSLADFEAILSEVTFADGKAVTTSWSPQYESVRSTYDVRVKIDSL